MAHNVSDVGEKQIISSLIMPLFRSVADTVEVGVGDDAAVIRVSADLSLALTIDRIPQDLVAYKLGLMDEYHLGRYLVSVNLSDLAAMGAMPLCILLSLCLPKSFSMDALRGLLQGAHDRARASGASVLGGDTKHGTSLNLVAAAVGTIPSGSALTRGAANPGDLLFCTGRPGLFGMALAYFLVAKPSGLALPPSAESTLRSKLVSPQPKTAEGCLLRLTGRVQCCQDVSDGVSQTVRELAAASGVRCVLDWGVLREIGGEEASTIASHCDCAVEDVLLGPGADLELVFTARPDAREAIEGTMRERGVEVHVIGHCEQGEGTAISCEGSQTADRHRGWEHFGKLSDLSALRNLYKRPRG